MYITEKEIQLKRNEPYVEIIISGDGEPWTGGINGRFYRISRGVKVRVPKNLATLIRQNEQVAIVSEQEMKAFKSDGGKCLGGRE